MGKVPVGLGGHYNEFARNTETSQPFTTAATGYVDVVAEVSVHGGTVESTRTEALKLIEQQDAKVPLIHPRRRAADPPLQPVV